jgi:hypothetical protein
LGAARALVAKITVIAAASKAFAGAGGNFVQGIEVNSCSTPGEERQSEVNRH